MSEQNEMAPELSGARSEGLTQNEPRLGMSFYLQELGRDNVSAQDVESLITVLWVDMVQSQGVSLDHIQTDLLVEAIQVVGDNAVKRNLSVISFSLGLGLVGGLGVLSREPQVKMEAIRQLSRGTEVEGRESDRQTLAGVVLRVVESAVGQGIDEPEVFRTAWPIVGEYALIPGRQGFKEKTKMLNQLHSWLMQSWKSRHDGETLKIVYDYSVRTLEWLETAFDFHAYAPVVHHKGVIDEVWKRIIFGRELGIEDSALVCQVIEILGAYYLSGQERTFMDTRFDAIRHIRQLAGFHHDEPEVVAAAAEYVGFVKGER